MSVAGTETEPSPTRIGLVKSLTRPRRKKHEPPTGSSRNSWASNEGGAGEGHGRLRSSIEAAVEKIKGGATSERRRASKVDEKSSGAPHGRLLGRTKRKIKQLAEARAATGPPDSDEGERGRSVGKRSMLEDSPDRSLGEGSGREAGQSDGSLMTDGSEMES